MHRRHSAVTALALLAVLAVLALSAAPGSATLHTINQVGLTFSPDSINVAVGDTVQWVHSGGTHTVTNGEGAADANAGTIFDAPLSAASPLFTHVFGSSGRVPFFCRPHEIVNMKGVIIVEAATSAVDPDVSEQAWGRVKALYR